MIISSLSFAKGCQIDRITSDQLSLSSKYRSQAATSFNIICDSHYAIQFNSRNLTNSNGASYVMNERNDRLRTHMTISGGGESRWNTPISQVATDLSKFVVMVKLQDLPTSLTPAGRYTDSLYVRLIY